jgi:bile acid-coenzyme A ligase
LLFAKSRWQVEQRQLIVSSLYHFVSFSSLIEGVLAANTTVLQRRVDPAMTLDLIDAQSIEWMLTTPTHMQEILDAPGVTSARLSSIRGILHTAGFCPPDLKREWLRLLSPHRIFEMYGATEGIGVTFAGGVEWLEHPGTVGKGFLTRVQVCDENGIPHPPGEVGRVYMRKFGVTPDQQSGRSWLKRLPGGFQSLGDLGWMDEGGYLFLVGREDDRVTVRGSDVFPAKVDMVLRSYPGVKDASMFIVDSPGAESELRGCVVPRAGISLDPERVREFCSARLSAEERPTSIDLLRKLPRTDMGKLRRRISLRELRSLQ